MFMCWQCFSFFSRIWLLVNNWLFLVRYFFRVVCVLVDSLCLVVWCVVRFFRMLCILIVLVIFLWVIVCILQLCLVLYSRFFCLRVCRVMCIGMCEICRCLVVGILMMCLLVVSLLEVISLCSLVSMCWFGLFMEFVYLIGMFGVLQCVLVVFVGQFLWWMVKLVQDWFIGMILRLLMFRWVGWFMIQKMVLVMFFGWIGWVLVQVLLQCVWLLLKWIRENLFLYNFGLRLVMCILVFCRL